MEKSLSPIKGRLRSHSDKHGRSKCPSENGSEKKQKESPTLKETPKTPKKASAKKVPSSKVVNNKTTMENIESMLRNLTATVATMQKDVNEIKTSKFKFDNFNADVERDRSDLISMQTKRDSDSLKIKLLSAIVIRQDQKLEAMSKEIEWLKKGAKKPNFSIDGIMESETEKTNKDRIAAVKKFLKEELGMKEVVLIKQAYRVGVKSPKTMMVILENSEDKHEIFSLVSNLKGKKNARKCLFFISDDMTEQERETRSYYRDLICENGKLDSDDRLQIKLRKGRIYANNQVIKTDIRPPTPADILTMTDEELENVHQTKTYEVGEHNEENSDFYSYMMRVKSLDEVEAGLAKIKIKHGDATHVVTAYRFENAKGPFHQGYFDDEELGAGRASLQVLKDKDTTNLAVYTARYYGGKNLGKRRFQIYASLAEKAVQTYKIRLDKLKRANRLRRSSSQLSQLSQVSYMHSTENEDDHHDEGTTQNKMGDAAS